MSAVPSGNPNVKFDEDHFDFADAVPSGFTSSNQISSMTATMELVKSIALSRPFLLAVIAFLLYKLWNAGSSSSSKKSSGPSIISVETVGSGRTSIHQEKLSRKSTKNVSGIPPVTMAAPSSNKK